MQGTKTLIFSIDGSFITTAAREKLYYNHDLAGAIELLLACTQTEQISREHRVGDAIAILDGTKELVGTYPNPDYGLANVPEDRRPKQNLKTYAEAINTELARLKADNKILMDKLACIGDTLSDTQMKQIDAEWRRNYFDRDEHGSEHHSIFGIEQETVSSTLLDSYLRRMTSSCDEPDYGWLMPDGTFEPVGFGNHAAWAYEWLDGHEPDWYTKLRTYRGPCDRASLHMDEAEDYFQNTHRAALIHNPALGEAVVTAAHELTKAQKEFLYDYYAKRGLTEKANALYRD